MGEVCRRACGYGWKHSNCSIHYDNGDFLVVVYGAEAGMKTVECTLKLLSPVPCGHCCWDQSFAAIGRAKGWRNSLQLVMGVVFRVHECHIRTEFIKLMAHNLLRNARGHDKFRVRPNVAARDDEFLVSETRDEYFTRFACASASPGEGA